MPASIGGDLSHSEPPIKRYNNQLEQRIGGVDATTPMSNHSASPLPEDGYRLKLNNWLQHRGRIGELGDGAREVRGQEPVRWYANYTSPFHFSLRSLCSHLQPIVKGEVYGTGSGNNKRAAKEEAAKATYLRLIGEEVARLAHPQMNQHAP